MPAVTTAEVKDALAFHLKGNTTAVLPSPDLIDAQVTAAVATTAVQFQSLLLGLGYSLDQGNAWLAGDEGRGYQLDQTLWRLLRDLASADNADLWAEKFNVLKDFAPGFLVIGGVVVTPEGDTTGAASGRLEFVDGLDLTGGCRGTGPASVWTGRSRVWGGW